MKCDKRLETFSFKNPRDNIKLGKWEKEHWICYNKFLYTVCKNRYYCKVRSDGKTLQYTVSIIGDSHKVTPVKTISSEDI